MDTRNRRSLIKAAAVGGGVALSGGRDATRAREDAGRLTQATAPPTNKVRIGFVGVGPWGTRIVSPLLRITGCQIVTACDIIPERVERPQRVVQEKGDPERAGYSRGPVDYRRMCQRDDLELIMTATPWELHAPVCVTALNKGKHTTTEVPAPRTIDECWQMVEASGKNNKHCAILENYRYFREVMSVLNLIPKGVFGEPMPIYEHLERRVHIHNRTNKPANPNVRAHPQRTWEPISNYYDEYEHPLWRDLGSVTRSSGHGGGDYLCFYSLINGLRTRRYPDIDVYDTAAWSGIIELSEKSATNRSKAVDFPDFTRGAWNSRKPIPISGA